MPAIYLVKLSVMNNKNIKNHFLCESYDTKERFNSYWHQIDEIIKLKPKRILEIGVGNRFVSRYLKERGFNISTLDSEEQLLPDYVGSVLNMPFKNNEFDVVACFEVLEHLPYSDFNKALSEISRVSSSTVLLSLPDVTRNFRFLVKVPTMQPIKIFIPFPRIRKRIHKYDNADGHYWEIGEKDYPLKKIKAAISDAGFKLKNTYRVFELPYNRFFILEK